MLGDDDDVLRPAMSMLMFCAAPHRAEPTAKKPSEASMTGLLPKIWARPPESGRNAVEESAYAVPIQTNSVPPMSLMMVGSAVETDV
jgi:hypothetical protein